jgi:hypothetical protein
VASDEWATQWTIKKLEGLPKGTTALVCPTEKLPMGWVVVDKKRLHMLRCFWWKFDPMDNQKIVKGGQIELLLPKL